MGKLDDMLSASGTSRIELKNADFPTGKHSQLRRIFRCRSFKAECAKIPLDDFFRKVILK
ncbi:MAG: hypothetical protein ACLUKN_16035 [Bacilli bacterium]